MPGRFELKKARGGPFMFNLLADISYAWLDPRISYR